VTQISLKQNKINRCFKTKTYVWLLKVQLLMICIFLTKHLNLKVYTINSIKKVEI